MQLMLIKSELIRHLEARIKLADLEAESLRAKGAHTNAQKSYAHRDAYQNLLAIIDVDVNINDETDRINDQIKNFD